MRLLPLLVLLCGAAHAQVQYPVTLSGYLPPLPEREPAPWVSLCDEPWIELVGDDGVHSEAWFCRPLDYTCFSLIGEAVGYGCQAAPLQGWVLVDRPEEPVGGYRAEIIAQVVDPCMLSSVRSAGLTEFVSEAEALDLMKTMQTEVVETTVAALVPLVTGQPAAAREQMYAASLNICISSAEEASR